MSGRSRLECEAAASALEGALHVIECEEAAQTLARLADEWREEAREQRPPEVAGSSPRQQWQALTWQERADIRDAHPRLAAALDAGEPEPPHRPEPLPDPTHREPVRVAGWFARWVARH